MTRQAQCGVGCTVAYLVKPLMAALRKRHTFVAHSSRYASADSCTGSRAGKLSCFFQRYDSCPSFEGEGATQC